MSSAPRPMPGASLSSPRGARRQSAPAKNVVGLTKATSSAPWTGRTEEITRTVCPSPSVTALQQCRRSSVTGQSQECAASHSSQRKSLQASPSCSPLISPHNRRKSGLTYPSSPEASSRKVPSHGGNRNSKGEKDEAAKTITAIDEALQAVKTVLKADSRDCRRGRLNKSSLDQYCPSPSLSVKEDVESCFETESIVSTACTSTHSEDGLRRLNSLENARNMFKEQVCAEERSMGFTHGLVAKLDEIQKLRAGSCDSCCDKGVASLHILHLKSEC